MAPVANGTSITMIVLTFDIEPTSKLFESHNPAIIYRFSTDEIVGLQKHTLCSFFGLDVRLGARKRTVLFIIICYRPTIYAR